MNIVATQNRYTPEDLLNMPDGDWYELVDGQLVERKMSRGSSYVAGQVNYLVTAHVRPRRLGYPYPEGASYQCFPNHPSKVRRADFSFILAERLTPDEATGKGHFPIAPDLAVEVVSPNDLYYEVDEKVDEWMQAGVRLLWVINPETRSIRIYRADGSSTTLREGAEISGESAVPGFRCHVRGFFALPADWPEPPPPTS